MGCGVEAVKGQSRWWLYIWSIIYLYSLSYYWFYIITWSVFSSNMIMTVGSLCWHHLFIVDIYMGNAFWVYKEYNGYENRINCMHIFVQCSLIHALGSLEVGTPHNIYLDVYSWIMGWVYFPILMFIL